MSDTDNLQAQPFAARPCASWIPYGLPGLPALPADGQDAADSRQGVRRIDTRRPRHKATKDTSSDPWQALRQRFIAAGLDADMAAGYADLVCEVFRGTQVYFATRPGALSKSERDQLIRVGRQAGQSLASLAKQYGLSRTRVHRLCMHDPE